MSIHRARTWRRTPSGASRPGTGSPGYASTDRDQTSRCPRHAPRCRDLLLTGCGDQPGPAPTGTAAAATSPALPTSYDFTLTSSCGERPLIGDYRVSVRDDRVTRATSLDPDYPEPTLTDVPTLRDLVDMAGAARPDAVVEYVVDDAGVPRSLSLDPMPNAIDDEECYEVTDLVVVARG